jgi:hypothetical protein
VDLEQHDDGRAAGRPYRNGLLSDADHRSTTCDDAWTNHVQTVVQSYLPGNSANYTLTHSCAAAASPVPRLMTITASYTVGSMSVPGATGVVGLVPGFTLTTQATVPLN